MALVRWRFDDPTDASSYTFDMNPNEGGTPTLKKNMSYQNTAGPNGVVLAFEGRDNVETLTVSGVLKEEVQLIAFQTWYAKRHQITVTDDLLRVFTIYITGFNATRKRSIAYPWKHDYTLEYIILDWV